MSEAQDPFADVVALADGFSIPELKWRELVFVRALVPAGDGCFVRDPSRPLPPFRQPDLFPDGVRFRVDRNGERVELRRVAGQGSAAREGRES